MSCSKKDIDLWLREIRLRTVDGRHVRNKAQFRVVKRVATRMCAEMRAVAKQDYSGLGEPLRWSIHGGPGTGKSRVVKMLKEELFGNI